MSTRILLNEIVHCPHVRFCVENPSADHPCREIVASQELPNLGHRQVPEPWSGQIEQVPILFLSSNPSISTTDVYPRWSWSDDEMDDYFNHRFGGGHKEWIVDGKKALLTTGTYSHSVKFWAAVRQRAIELLGPGVRPGTDYALTEIVHCKSRSEIGVEQAQNKCVETYLKRVLELAEAKVVVVLGARAGQAIQNHFKLPEKTLVSEEVTIRSRKTIFAFLPHPTAFKPKSFLKVLQAHELEKLRAFLH